MLKENNASTFGGTRPKESHCSTICQNNVIYLSDVLKTYKLTRSILNIKDTQFTNVNHKWETIWIWHIEQSQAIWLQTELI